MPYRLVLHPRDPDYAPENISELIEVLRQMGFIGDAWGEPQAQRFLIGDRFLQLVTFMGCAPAIELAPATGMGAAQSDEFCHVGISPIHPAIQFIADGENVMPRCPHCRRRYAAWQEQLASWQTDQAHQARCPACRKHFSPTALDWRQAAGFGRIFISVFNVYPREALPTDALLGRLGEATSSKWLYFYVR